MDTGISGSVNDLGEPDGAGVLILPDGKQCAAGDTHHQKQQNDDDKFLFHSVSPPLVSVPAREPRGSRVCKLEELPVLMYTSTPGST